MAAAARRRLAAVASPVGFGRPPERLPGGVPLRHRHFLVPGDHSRSPFFFLTLISSSLPQPFGHEMESGWGILSPSVDLRKKKAFGAHRFSREINDDPTNTHLLGWDLYPPPWACFGLHLIQAHVLVLSLEFCCT